MAAGLTTNVSPGPEIKPKKNISTCIYPIVVQVQLIKMNYGLYFNNEKDALIFQVCNLPYSGDYNTQ